MKNYHTHTTRCRHADGKDREYVENAIKSGYTEIGFSDHAPMIFNDKNYYSTYRMFPNQIDDYVNSVLKLKNEYKNEISIKLGFELEYYPELFKKELEYLKSYNIDYLILGQHFTDNEYEPFAAYSGNATKDVVVFDKYLNQCLEGLETGKFSYLAHPDLIKFTGKSEVYDYKMREFCKSLKKLGYPLEYNMLGFTQKRNYPDERFWKIVAEVKNDVVIGLDAHNPKTYLDETSLNKMKEELKLLGITPIENINLIKP